MKRWKFENGHRNITGNIKIINLAYTRRGQQRWGW